MSSIGFHYKRLYSIFEVMFPVILLAIAVISGFPIVASDSCSPSLNKIVDGLTAFVDNFIDKKVLSEDDSRNEFRRLTTPEMIRKEGYLAESHEIVTSDRYVLTLHRIPGPPGSPGVFIQHGLLGSSFDWVLPGKHKGLAFILADLGYDVWLGNSRGNTYSKKHKTLCTDSLEYWDFSWHEMGIYDLPAAINYTSNMLNDSLIYIGFSQGTTQFYVMASEKPQFAAEKVKVSFNLSPIAFMSNAVSPLRLLAPPPLSYLVENFYRLYARGQLLPHSSMVNFFGKHICNVSLFAKKICTNLLFTICGFDHSQFNYTLLPRILNGYPEGSSVYTIVHYGQEIMSGRFQKYDYGASKNLEKYKQSIPPEYDLSKIRVPIGLFSAENDWLSHPLDVQKLYNSLPNKIFNYKVKYPEFNHLDWMWGVDAPTLVYKKMITEMEKYQRRFLFFD